jgi:hypothetical protein
MYHLWYPLFCLQFNVLVIYVLFHVLYPLPSHPSFDYVVHPIVSCSQNASFKLFCLLSNMGGNGVVISPPFGACVYPWRHLSVAVQNSFVNFQCVIAFCAVALDSSLFVHASIDGHINICIQSSSCVFHMQHDFFPPQYLPFVCPMCHRLKHVLLMLTCIILYNLVNAIS